MRRFSPFSNKDLNVVYCQERKNVQNIAKISERRLSYEKEIILNGCDTPNRAHRNRLLSSSIDIGFQEPV